MTRATPTEIPPPVSEIPSERISYEQFLNLPGPNHDVEWMDGRMIPMSPVTEPHENLRGLVHPVLRHFAEAHDLGRIYSEPFQMKTGPDLPGRAPDVLFIANRNLGRLKRLCLEGPADLVVEIISPGSRAVDRGEKFYEYEQGGVPEYWLLDPERKTAEFYQRGSDGIYRPVQLDSQGVYRSRAMPGLWMKVEWFWQSPLPSILAVLREWKLV